MKDRESVKSDLERYNLQMSMQLYQRHQRESESREVIESEFTNNVQLEDEIYKSIDEIYFSDPRIEHPGGLAEAVGEESLTGDRNTAIAQLSPAENDLLCRLPSTLDLGFVVGEKKRLSKQLMVVSKREHELIIKKQPILIVEFTKLQKLHSSLTELIEMCHKCRHLLMSARKDLVINDMIVLNCYRKKNVTKKLIKSLGTVKSLQSN